MRACVFGFATESGHRAMRSACPFSAKSGSRSACARHVTPKVGLVLPVLPHYIIDFQVAGNGCADGREKAILAKLRQQSEFLQLVLYGILELCKTKLDTLCVQSLVQFGECIAGGSVHAGDRLPPNDQPTSGR